MSTCVPALTTTDSLWRIRRVGAPGTVTIEPFVVRRSVTTSEEPIWRMLRWLPDTNFCGESTTTSRGRTPWTMRGSRGRRPTMTGTSRAPSTESPIRTSYCVKFAAGGRLSVASVETGDGPGAGCRGETTVSANRERSSGSTSRTWAGESTVSSASLFTIQAYDASDSMPRRRYPRKLMTCFTRV